MKQRAVRSQLHISCTNPGVSWTLSAPTIARRSPVEPPRRCRAASPSLAAAPHQFAVYRAFTAVLDRNRPASTYGLHFFLRALLPHRSWWQCVVTLCAAKIDDRMAGDPPEVGWGLDLCVEYSSDSPKLNRLHAEMFIRQQSSERACFNTYAKNFSAVSPFATCRDTC